MRSVDLSADFRKRMLTEFDQWETQRHLFRKINELRATYIQDKERSGKVRLQWAFLDQEELMNWFNYLLTFADEPIYKSREKFYKTPPEGSRFHNDTATYLLWYREDYDAILAQSHCFRILNAIQIQAKQAGKQVGYIGELGLPDEVFQNPISGEEVLVTQTSAGWKISIEGAKFLKNISVVHFKEACVPLEHVERPDK